MYAKARLPDVNMASNKMFSTESQYINMIGKKTACLFEVSCALGVLSAVDPNMEDVENLHRLEGMSVLHFN